MIDPTAAAAAAAARGGVPAALAASMSTAKPALAGPSPSTTGNPAGPSAPAPGSASPAPSAPPSTRPASDTGLPHCVVLVPTTDPSRADRLVQALRGGGTPAGGAHTTKLQLDVHVFRSTPQHVSAQRLYVFQHATSSGSRWDAVAIEPSGARITAPRHALALVTRLKNLWTPRQVARIDGIVLDLRDFAVSVGQLYVASAPVATVVYVAGRVPNVGDAVVRDLVDRVVVPAVAGDDGGGTVETSPVLDDAVACFLHVFRARGVL
ncbi:hypothetical protein AMAG_11540 [Allomyces macrogynus ATCC 38327]|uniref:Mediator of RNA polymerase II transcription subunit 20 n=1 Tax=Allomyces macrogynus (strain ATCC 38327) TaxID=578462 RepID=A0A0L0SUZ1_ALLM3|nr:hypothetical protein AMAG_11540 [Allomyces macrogynus ATCC 38327]|eukprot:KNE66398.1 hypothetical protein AMAG_11540 [Allomyces macrogynus ATCC 38327]